MSQELDSIMQSLFHNLAIWALGSNAAVFVGGIRFVWKRYRKYKEVINELMEQHEILWAEHEEQTREIRKLRANKEHNVKQIYGSHSKHRDASTGAKSISSSGDTEEQNNY